MGLNAHQEMFLVIYSILYGVMLQSLTTLKPFHLAQAFKFIHYWIQKKENILPDLKFSFNRTVASFLVLNLLPFGYLILVFNFLGKKLPKYPLILLLVCFLGLGVFGFYRFYIGLMLWAHNRFYTDKDFCKMKEKRNLNIAPESNYQFIATILYFLPLLALFII